MVALSLTLALYALLPLQLAETNAHRTVGYMREITPRQQAANPAQEYLVHQQRAEANRFTAVIELGKLGEDAASAVALLSNLIFDRLENEEFKLLAFDTLGKIGTPSSLDVLTRVLASPNEDLRNAAQLAINRIESLQVLLQELASDEPNIRLVAARSLSDFGSAAFSALEMAYLDGSAQPELKSEAIVSMARAIERFDFGPQKIESLIANSDKLRHLLGIELLCRLVNGANPGLA